MESPDWIHLWPTTRGTYRVSGLADTDVGEQPWLVVLKIVGAVDLPGHHEPTEPFYWKREPTALSSELLQDWPGPFAPVRCWAVDDVAEDESWVWLECLESGDTKRRWGPREHAAAAFDLGVFNGQWSGRTAELENVDWLARRWLRAWVDLASVWGADRVAQDAACWEHPLIAACVPAATRVRYQDLLRDAPALLTAWESLPVVLAHQDPQWRNLFAADPSKPARRGVRTVAIDWSFVGLAPLGADLGYLVGCDIEHRAVPPAAAARHVQEMTSAYLAGLQRHGWSGDERAVRFVRAATAALQMVPLFGAEISWLDDTSIEEGVEPGRWPDEVAERHGISVPELMSGWANNFTLMLDLGDEARRLAAQLF